jgi:glycosyltransferase involved in cell wall biosynthesis
VDGRAERAAIPPVGPATDRPLWSVMVPTYECAGYLRETLRSVLVQDPGPELMQIEVVDDASTDDPEAVVQELGEGRVGFFRQPRNVGHVENFNTCLRRARGQLVHLLHGDDAVREGFYETMRRPFERRPDVGAAFCRQIYIDEDGHWTALGALRAATPGLFEDAAERMLALFPVAQPPAMVVRRSVYERLGGFDERAYSEDVEMWVRIAAHYPVWSEPEPLALYRTRAGSRSTGWARSAREIRGARETIELCREHLPPPVWSRASRAARRRCSRWAAANAAAFIEERDAGGAAAQLREVVACEPSPRGVARAVRTVAAHAFARRTPDAEPARVGAPAPEVTRRAPPRSTESEPLWSVLIPTYECAGYLRETLRSVLVQDPGPELMQIEVVDDASTDDPEAVVQELGEGRVGFFRQPRNVGHVENFNTCLRRARGQLVHLLHGDDAVREGFYETMRRPFERRPDVGAAFCRYIAMDEDGNWQVVSPLERRESGVLDGWLAKVAVGQRLQTPSMVVRRAVYEDVGGFDARLAWTEDWEMWVRIASRYPVWFEPEPLALYRIHSASSSGRLTRTAESIRDTRRAIELIRAHLPARDEERLASEARHELATTALRRARRLIGTGELAAGSAHLREAVRTETSPGVLARSAVVAGLLVRAKAGRSRPLKPGGTGADGR